MEFFLRKVKVASLAFFVLATLSIPAQTDAETPAVAPSGEYISISKYGLAVADLEPSTPDGTTDENATALPTRLVQNLRLIGVFNILDKSSFSETEKRAGLDASLPMDYDPWLQIGADFLVKGTIADSDSKITLELRLFDVPAGQQILGKRYHGHVDNAPKMINLFTNAVLEALTGLSGSFGSEIIFVSGDNEEKSIAIAELGGDGVKVIADYKDGPNSQPAIGPGQKKAWVQHHGKKWNLFLNGKIVSSGEEMDPAPAFRPDGILAATLDGPTSTNIYAFDEKAKALLTSVDGRAAALTFSPDGSRMAYVSNQGGSPQIYVAPASGGQGTRLTSEGKCTDPAWSPKGDLIAFVSSETDICIINPNGTGLMQLTNGQGANTSPSFSPDGRMIVFSSTRDGQSHLYVMSASGQNPQLLLPSYAAAQRSPSWSPAMPARK